MTQPSLRLETPAPAPPTAWDGQLSQLLGVLSIEAMEKPGRWAHRKLRHGALVAVMLDADRRRILRIAREDAPASDLARARWQSELATFHKHLGTAHWQPLPGEEVKGVVARFLELWRGEVAPGLARCDRCEREIPFDMVWATQVCRKCARALGDEEVAESRDRGSQR